MARGIYSACGHWPEADLPRMLEMLRAIGRDVERRVPEDQHGQALPDAARAVLVAVVREIRAFEARVGIATGVDAEIVTMPTGQAIELGNRGHRGFGAEHEAAAAIVAQALAEVMRVMGAERVAWLTMD
jgi:hypothetical protein